VGGDFYHFFQRDSSCIVILGDVSGKGLKAAMLVTLIAGALRREEHAEPSAILAGLNRVIAGDMGGGFVTCCCVRLDPGGRVVIASAGHLPPYVDGHEAQVHAGLPLGLSADATYEETPHTLNAQLTVVSDGVVEAANRKGELFGFERTREISGKSAKAITEAAKAWGQNDDITVVTVRRRG
jgi:serine phosphatase RsbU (regulator of sigma subunit)